MIGVTMEELVNLMTEEKLKEISPPLSVDNIALRDWFAGMALQGVMSGVNMRDLTTYMPDYAANEAYKIADAMIKARG